MRNLTLRQLRAISQIARDGKIVSAAKHLGLTPSAVTLQVQSIEDEIGLVLFDRAPEGMRPTAAGLAAIEAARAIEERLRLLSDEIDAIRGVRKGSLVVGAVSTAKYFAPSLFAGFMREYAGVDMKLVVGNREETIASLRNHLIDVALMGRPPRDLSVQACVFGDHPLVVVAAPDHPLTGQRDISKETVAGEHFIIREPGSGTRISFERFLGDVPGRLDDPGTEMDSNETIKQAVMAGLGVAFISAHTVAWEVDAGRLAILDVAGLPIRRQWFAVSRADRAVTPVMSAFEQFLARKGAAFLPLLGTLYPNQESGLL